VHKLNWPQGPRQVNKTLSYNLCVGMSQCFALSLFRLGKSLEKYEENCMSHNTHLLLLFLLLTMPFPPYIYLFHVLLYFFAKNFKEGLALGLNSGGGVFG